MVWHFFIIVIFFCYHNINYFVSALSSHERHWVTNNLSLPPNHDQFKDEKRSYFLSRVPETYRNDNNLFRVYFRWSVIDQNNVNSSSTWDLFILTDLYKDYIKRDEKKKEIDNVIGRGHEDPKWYQCYFEWSSKTGQNDVASWKTSSDYDHTRLYFQKKLSMMRNNQYTEDDVDVYWKWYEDHINDSANHNDIDSWRRSRSYSEMVSKDTLRAEIARYGYTDNVYFRAYWLWWNSNKHKTFDDFMNTNEFKLLHYKEIKRKELINAGYTQKEQFHKFWEWFKQSSHFINPISKETCEDWYNSGYTTTGIYKLTTINGIEYNTTCEMNIHGGKWTKFKTIFASNDIHRCNGEFCNTPISTEFVNNDCGWLFSKSSMETKGGLVMFREINSPHKTFIMNWLYNGSRCDGDRFFRILTADYSRDDECHPQIFDWSIYQWVQGGDGWCDLNDFSQFLCSAENARGNHWPNGAKGIRFHYATRNDPNGNADYGVCKDAWWTGWTSSRGSDRSVIENFDRWSTNTNGDVEVFYKSSSSGIGSN